jgi:hypothetical protein
MGLTSKFAYGALAGLAGAAGMHGFRLAWEAAIRRQPKHAVFGFDEEADVNSSQLLCRILLQKTISRSAARKTGMALHYLYGAMIGGSYFVLASRKPQLRSGSGTAFGAVLWLVGDEIPVTLSRISDPRNKSAASHAAAFSAHLLFGAVVEAIHRLAHQQIK